MYCRNCGAEIPDGSKFCGNCGARLAISDDCIEEDVVIVHKPESKDSKNGKSKKLSKSEKAERRKDKILGNLIALGILVVIAFLFFTKDVYVFSKMTYHPVNEFKQKEKESIESLFHDSYLFKGALENDDQYFIVDINTGLGFYVNDLQSAWSTDINADLKVNGKYAHVTIEFVDYDSTISVSYYKASIIERFNYLIRFFI